MVFNQHLKIFCYILVLPREYSTREDKTFCNSSEVRITVTVFFLLWGLGDFPVSYPKRIPLGTLEIRHSESFMIMGSYSAMWSLPLTKFEWHSDPWLVTVTSQTIILSTNFRNLISSLALNTEWRVVSMKHLQRVWHATRESLPFRTPDSVSLFGTCLCSNCWDQISRTCRVFTRLFTLHNPRYFLDFAQTRALLKYNTYKSSSYTIMKLLNNMFDSKYWSFLFSIGFSYPWWIDLESK